MQCVAKGRDLATIGGPRGHGQPAEIGQHRSVPRAGLKRLRRVERHRSPAVEQYHLITALRLVQICSGDNRSDVPRPSAENQPEIAPGYGVDPVGSSRSSSRG